MSDSVRPVDCSPAGSSVHEILQARILESVAISFSRNLPDPGIGSSALQADSLLSELPGKLNQLTFIVQIKNILSGLLGMRL